MNGLRQPSSTSRNAGMNWWQISQSTASTLNTFLTHLNDHRMAASAANPLFFRLTKRDFQRVNPPDDARFGLNFGLNSRNFAWTKKLDCKFILKRGWDSNLLHIRDVSLACLFSSLRRTFAMSQRSNRKRGGKWRQNYVLAILSSFLVF